MSENREPKCAIVVPTANLAGTVASTTKYLNYESQNIECRMSNIEGKENFIIRNSLFDIRYSK